MRSQILKGLIARNEARLGRKLTWDEVLRLAALVNGGK